MHAAILAAETTILQSQLTTLHSKMSDLYNALDSPLPPPPKYIGKLPYDTAVTVVEKTVEVLAQMGAFKKDVNGRAMIAAEFMDAKVEVGGNSRPDEKDEKAKSETKRLEDLIADCVGKSLAEMGVKRL
ncbi:hypothetical protein HDU85_005077 [Gaertneriomyces sp. JEL0708]|nr:hypothetical protein HDU85_005077 [Gaertneriomyces sp. JEL0708]